MKSSSSIGQPMEQESWILILHHHATIHIFFARRLPPPTELEP